MASLHVAMVCLGNICRSPMAAAVLANKARKVTDIEVIVSSSGTSGWHIGEGPHPTSKLVWEKAGYSHDHKASQFKANDYFVNDYILVMDSSNYENVLSLAPSEEDRSKVFYLRSFDPALSHIDPQSSDYFKLEVPDPYNQPEESYQRVLAMIESAVDGFIERVIQDHGA
jgi:protein-tyrosine phosphatase